MSSRISNITLFTFVRFKWLYFVLISIWRDVIQPVSRFLQVYTPQKLGNMSIYFRPTFLFSKIMYTPVRFTKDLESHEVEWGLVDRSKNPVDDLQEWDDTESETEAKEPSQGGHEVHRTHSDASLKLYKDFRWPIIFQIHITHDSILAEEDVNDSNILLPSIVELVLEIKVEDICCWRLYRWLSDKQIVLVPLPHWVCQCWDVGGNWAVQGSVNLFHLEWELKVTNYKIWSCVTLSVQRAGNSSAFSMQSGFRLRLRESHCLKETKKVNLPKKVVDLWTKYHHRGRLHRNALKSYKWMDWIGSHRSY